MKLGINLLCLNDFVTEDHLPILRRLKALGYDGVEIPILSGEPDHYAWLGRQLDAIGLERCATAIVPTPDVSPIAADPETRAKGRAHLNWALDCAIALGAQSLGGPMHAPIGHFTGSGPTESELNYGVEAHRDLAQRAENNGLFISLEPLNRFETYFLNTTTQCRDYALRVDHPAFRIMYDTFHANIEDGNQVAAFQTVAPHVGIVHVSENDRGIPGRGHIDFAHIFKAIRALGYDGWLTLEAFGAGLPGIAAATRVWRPLFPDHETLFSESASFIRKTWAEAK
ncbi:sugar phosphate isomerase/epimerase [Devosia sp. MC532]|uniref:sugar phosphate isomerase/epimerase family protein n=1 Tax=Devosia sp. MC532 TaxID=2799788 RepID=UPI0018F7713F|nr:sugar phosphate isomerase/epimerase family protein [Devosia sp. MC532]MBJ7578123.1 sugar phosphate isomerase/epimerase [Devosia sp. MC532]